MLPRMIVIGAGAVGLYTASQLAGRGHHVVVIEAGDSNLGSFDTESYETVGRPHVGIRLGRGRSLGGTTNLWGGQLVEFQPIDFHGREWLPGSRWPVSYEEIAPYYKLTYQNLGFPPQLQQDDKVWQGIARSRPHIGVEFEVFLTRWLAIPNFAVMFAKQIQTDERMSVLGGHTAVAFRGAGGRIHGVRVVDSHRQSHWIEGDTFILAAGTIENSRLLLHTGQDPAWQSPWRQNHNIGRYFQDHLAGTIGAFQPKDKRGFFDMFCNIIYAGHQFQPKIRMRDEVLARQHILNSQGIFAFESEVSEHLVYLKQFLRAAFFSRKLTGIGDLLRNGVGVARYLVPLMWKYIQDHRVFVPSTAKIFLSVQAEQGLSGDSRISIDKTVMDSWGLPRVTLDWRLGGHELTSIREFAIQIQEALHTAGIGQLTIDEDLLSLNPRFLSKLGDTYHQAGGTLMASSEREGVVDKNLCVFGTENLYVAGASVFPTASNANTTFTALTLATRLVDHLTDLSGPITTKPESTAQYKSS
jgi:choline dehydrogenase-like flavoprotein